MSNEQIKSELPAGENQPVKKSETVSLKLNKNTLTVAVLGALILVSAAQSFQIYKMRGGSVAPASASSGAAVTPSSLENLPDMVGGC